MSKTLYWTEGQCDWWGSIGDKLDDTSIWYTIAERRLMPQAPTLHYLLRGMVGNPDQHMADGGELIGAYHALDQAMEAAQVDYNALHS